MKNKERFDQAIKALVIGFFKGTLAKGSCQACAVGNIVAHCNNVEASLSTIENVMIGADRVTSWRFLFVTECGQQKIRQGNIVELFRSCEDQVKEALRVISKTGYSEIELAKVEFAFETNTTLHLTDYYKYHKEEIMEDQYNGLMAVVDVLCEIEGIENASEYKEMFAYAK